MKKIVYMELKKTPVGKIFIGASPSGLAFLYFGKRPEKKIIEQEGKRFGSSEAFVKIGSAEIRSKMKDTEAQQKILSSAIGQLADYFGGRLKTFKIRKDHAGLTEFEKKVLQELDKIPCGKTSSYQEIAKKVGKPKAARAVGNAVGRNPFSLITPCHRVIKSDGSLGGFGAGPSIKKDLLIHEKASTRNL